MCRSDKAGILDLMLETTCRICLLRSRCIDETLRIRRLAFSCFISRFHARLADLAFTVRKCITALKSK
ncbi:MAG: hypothetical protein DRJ60_03240 [Thermoprotei archaeon]|nr:MAG: hypothetical protein DRJ60_03240 [Thermoprotei archaeon]